MTTKSPEDVFEQIYGDNKLPVRVGDNRYTTKSSEKLDDSVKTVEERVKYYQEILNNWRIAIMQNEQVIIVFCILFGLVYAYAINECTGNLDFPLYVYGLVVVIILLMSLLLIAEGSLPLVVILKFISSFTFGHASMMWLIAIDGHTWGWFSTDVCRYPATTDTFMWIILGGCLGYMVKSFEEIKAGKEV